MKRSVLTVVVTFSFLSAASASAQDTPRERFARGQAAYTQGDYETAVTEWTAAYAGDPRPLLQYNLAQAYERLGRFVEARQAYESYVNAADPTDGNLPDARARLSALRERLGRTALRLTGAPDGLAITVDGTDHGRTPRPDPISVEPGTHQVVAGSFRATVVVSAGQVVDVPVTIAGSGGGGDIVPPLVLTAGGGALLVTGLVLGGVAFGNAPSAVTDGARNDALTLATVGDVLWITGAAATVGGLVWLLLTSSSSAPNTATSSSFLLTPMAQPGGAGLVAFGRF